MAWRPYGSRSAVLKPCCRCGQDPPSGINSGWYFRQTVAEPTSASHFLSMARGRPGGAAAKATEAICGECLKEEMT